MPYDVRQSPTGAWELVEMRPVAVATFGEEDLARRTARLLSLADAAGASGGSAWEGDTFVAQRSAEALPTGVRIVAVRPGAPPEPGVATIPVLTHEEALAKLRGREPGGYQAGEVALEAEAGDAPPSPQPPAPSPQPPAGRA